MGEVIMEKFTIGKLEKKSLLIDPNSLDDYLGSFGDYETEIKKRVLLTGISRFSGSHLAERLVE